MSKTYTWDNFNSIPKFSQRNEQESILKYFMNQDGNFLDIGAYDGKTFSNTHALALLGWKGVCVEPSPSVIPALKKLYKSNKSVQIIDKGVAGESGKAYFFDSNGDAVSSLFEDEIQPWKNQNVKFDKVEIETLSVKDLLQECKIKQFDMINIDVEGDNFGVSICKELLNLSLRPKMIVIEVGGEERKLFASYMYSHGYKVLLATAENLVLCV